MFELFPRQRNVYFLFDEGGCCGREFDHFLLLVISPPAIRLFLQLSYIQSNTKYVMCYQKSREGSEYAVMIISYRVKIKNDSRGD